jgi:hypothetical protein
VLNAEVSDPAHGLYYLQQFGDRYHPQLIIYNMCGNDVMQTASFVGPERLFAFDPTGLLAVNSHRTRFDAPWDEYQSFAYPIARSARPHIPGVNFVQRTAAGLNDFAAIKWLHLLLGDPSQVADFNYAQAYEQRDGRMRLIDGTYNLGFFYRRGSTVVANMYDTFFEVVRGLSRIAADNNAGFLLVSFPQRYQAQSSDWKVIRRAWNLRDEDFDLDLTDGILTLFCRRYGIAFDDLLASFRQAALRQDLYMPGGDVHFNRHGHRIAATEVAHFISERVTIQ